MRKEIQINVICKYVQAKHFDPFRFTTPEWEREHKKTERRRRSSHAISGTWNDTEEKYKLNEMTSEIDLYYVTPSADF